MGRFLLGLIVGGGVVLGALRYHVVRADDGLHLIPKMSATLSETYVDIRKFGPRDWSDHPAVAAAIVRDNQGQLMKGSGVDSLWGGAERMLKSMNK